MFAISKNAVSPARPVVNLGTDSLMAVELRNRLLGPFGDAFTISATVEFDYPTIRSLAEYLAGQLPDSVPQPTGGTGRCVRPKLKPV
jgi:hypothetical protein